MKKLITILSIAILGLSFTSCTKENDELQNVREVNAAFGGTLSQNGTVTINGIPVQINEVYKVKTGDVLRFVDPGVDIFHQGFTLYSTTGGPNIVVSEDRWEQGFTYGEIIVDLGSVATSAGQDDVNLTYIIK